MEGLDMSRTASGECSEREESQRNDSKVSFVSTALAHWNSKYLSSRYSSSGESEIETSPFSHSPCAKEL